MKQIGYAFETIKIAGSGNGVDKSVAESRINEKIAAEGWTQVDVTVLRWNTGPNAEATDVVLMYVLQKDVDETKAKK